MGFSFRSLYTDDDQPEQRAALGSLPTTSGSIPSTGRQNSPNTVLSGIPGPLKGAEPIRDVVSRQVDNSSFSSLDELVPEPVFNEEFVPARSDVMRSVTAPGLSVAQAPAGLEAAEAEITLRAIFATSDAFTLDRIAILTAKLPGITSCIIKISGQAVLAVRGTETVQSVDTVIDFPRPEAFQPACAHLGLGKMNGVMLRSEAEPASCFSFAGVSLMARHSEVDLEPGLWEKLTLVTRATAGLDLPA